MLSKTIRTIFTVLLPIMSSNVVCAQTISEISQSNPLIITGAVGTQNTYRYSSSGNGYCSPMSNSVYANLNINLYGISMPFSFYYTNSCLDFNHPHVSFNISPKYKNWTGHFGLSSMDFGDYVMNMSFNGIGLEYDDKTWRAGMFYGRLRSAINDDPSNPYARSPQYKRMGWGFKAGYSNGKNAYVDLYLLRAYDCLNSLNESFRSSVRPQESLVVGIKGGYSPTHWLSFTANAATSAFSTDKEVKSISTISGFDKIFDTNYSSAMRFAGDISTNVALPFLNASLSYRIVQPDYTSLGTYYMSNNYQSVGITASSFLFRRVSLSGSFSRQSDNLSNEQLYTTYGYVYNLCASARITDHFNVGAMYNGYIQNQKDGTKEVEEDQRMNRRLSSYSLTPSYMFQTSSLNHCLSASLNYTENLNLNKFVLNESDVKTVALGFTYGVEVEPWGMDFSASYSHQTSDGYDAVYTSDVGTFTASRSFLSDKSLNVSATLSLCRNNVEDVEITRSLGAEVEASYKLKDAHLFSLSVGANRYGDANTIRTGSFYYGTDLTVSLNYAYTFSLMK